MTIIPLTQNNLSFKRYIRQEEVFLEIFARVNSTNPKYRRDRRGKVQLPTVGLTDLRARGFNVGNALKWFQQYK